MADTEFERIEMPDNAGGDRAVRRIAEAVHRLNVAVEQALKDGLTIELVRTSRLHDGAGNWGDQMAPVVRATKVVPE